MLNRSPTRKFFEADMKMILSAAALVFGICGAANACEGKKVDPVGMWKCEYQIGEQKLTLDFTIKKVGEKLAGTMNWPDQKGEKLKDVKLKDGTLTFSAVRKFMSNEIPLEFTLTIEKDELKGKAEVDIGGQKQEYELSGKKDKKEK